MENMEIFVGGEYEYIKILKKLLEKVTNLLTSYKLTKSLIESKTTVLLPSNTEEKETLSKGLKLCVLNINKYSDIQTRIVELISDLEAQREADKQGRQVVVINLASEIGISKDELQTIVDEKGISEE